MKKILGISIAAMLAVTPMLANATGADPTDATTASEPFLGLAISNTDRAAISSVGYVKGAYNAAIGAVNTRQEQLMNDAETPAAIDSEVKTEVGLANAASNTALVTEKAVRDAITAMETATGVNIMNATGQGLSWDSTHSKFDVNLTSNDGLEITAGANAGDPSSLGVKTGAGITTTSNGVEVNLKTNGGLATDNNQLEVTVDNSTIEIDSTNGIQIVDGGVGFAKLDSDDIVDQTNDGGINLTPGSASDTALVTEKAVSTAINSAITSGTTGLATETGVEETIAVTAITVPVYTTWGASSTTPVAATVTKPTYTDGSGEPED